MADPDGVGAPRAQSDRAMGAGSIAVVTVYFVAVTVMVLHGLVFLWPPSSLRDEGEVESANEEVLAELAILEERMAELFGKPPARPPDGGSDAAEVNEGGPSPSDGAMADAVVTEASTLSDETVPAAINGARPAADVRRKPSPTGESGAGKPGCAAGETPAHFLRLRFCLFPEERLFLIVMLAGALGGLVHSLRSFYWYLGNRQLVVSWMGMYVTLPVVGAAMAIVFYLVVRGGFTSSSSDMGTTNPFGFAAMAVLVGMFTEQAAQRLKDVAETALARAKKGKDHAAPPKLQRVEREAGPLVGGTEVTLYGSGFEQGIEVRFNGKLATDVQLVDEATLRAKTPAGTVPGPVTVQVVNPDGQPVTLANGYTYE